MTWLEMSRNPENRPFGWKVGECLWSPQRNAEGNRSGFWETMTRVQPGDIVFHLCGKPPKALFTGFSTASSSCISLANGPNGNVPLYRVNLAEFQQFETPVSLSELFKTHGAELRANFAENNKEKTEKERLFYVIQGGRLRCQNGAYLSELGDKLLELIFGLVVTNTVNKTVVVAHSAATGTALAEAARRLGHHEFARNVKRNFYHKCAFPGCCVDDPRFLIGAHIARWADHPELRGQTSNGLCLCLHHDKAFEIGSFTLDHMHRVVPRLGTQSPWIATLLQAHDGTLRDCQIRPSLDALAHHWAAHGFDTCLEAATEPG